MGYWYAAIEVLLNDGRFLAIKPVHKQERVQSQPTGGVLILSYLILSYLIYHADLVWLTVGAPL